MKNPPKNRSREIQLRILGMQPEYTVRPSITLNGLYAAKVLKIILEKGGNIGRIQTELLLNIGCTQC